MKDGDGAPRKKKYGPRIFTLFKVLSKLKFLRGTAFDPFGKHPDRVLERQLIVEYLETLEHIKLSLSDSNYDIALELANYPDDIRGFGHIKEKSLESVVQKKEKLLKQLVSNTNLAA
jgi:indolepyruvate ferredoxin oxidoreductase